MGRSASLLPLLAAALVARDARAGEPVEAILRILQRVRAPTGNFPPSVPRFFGSGFDDEAVGVTIRFASAPTPHDLDVLEDVIDTEDRDWDLPRMAGFPIRQYRTVSAYVPWQRLDAVAAMPGVERIDIGRRPGALHPMDVSVPEVQAPDAWEIEDPLGNPATGAIDADRIPEDAIPIERRMVIADIDSGIDVFHPMFFHLAPSTECIPFTGGSEFVLGDTITLEGIEVPLSLQDGVRVLGGGSEGIDGRLDPATDWLFVDGWRAGAIVPELQNGVRDFGRTDGFGEGHRTYGEPIFVVSEELPANGIVDQGDAFCPLAESKIRAMLVPVVRVLQRGDLAGNGVIDAPTTDRGHGTGVASVLCGGWEGLGRRFVGIAPGADLVLATTDATSFPVGAGLPFALDQRADVVLYEFSYLVTSFLDGSTNDELLIAEAAAAGVPQVAPTGNWGDSGKSIRVDLQAATEAAVGARIPEDRAGSGVSGISVVQVTLRWRDEAVVLAGEIEVPGKGEFGIVVGGEDARDDVRVLAESEVSDRGTAKLDLTILGIGETLPVGDWVLRLRTEDGAPVEVWGGGVDDRSGFSGGFVFLPPWPDSTTSAAGPATADGAIGVGSYSTRDTGGGRDQGMLSGFSGRGERIDGEPVVDVVAPGDYDVFWARDWGVNRNAWGWFTGFGGGTSAAGPHVAGAAAILLQIAPWSETEDIEAALRGGALADAFVGDAPNEAWGWGKLRIRDAALLLPERPAGPTPTGSFWGLRAPLQREGELPPGGDDPHTGARRFSARGGWDCRSMPGTAGSNAAGIAIGVALLLATRRGWRSRRP